MWRLTGWPWVRFHPSVAGEKSSSASWREKLFAFLARNAARPGGFFRLPSGRVLEVAGQIEI